MSSDGAPPQTDDHVRVEALRRLDLRHGLPTEAFNDLVAVIAGTLEADAVSIVAVEHERARVLATTAELEGAADIPRAWSLADILVSSPEPLLVIPASAPGADGAGQAGSADTDAPTTLAAHVIEAPGGERIGAIEVVWEGRRDIGDGPLSYLARCSSLAANMLHLGAEVSEYGRFIDLTPDPVAILDLDGAIEQVNPAFLGLVGAESDGDLLGRAFLELVERGDRARITAELSRALFVQRRRSQLELSLVDAKGRAIPCSVSAGHLRGPRRHLQLIVHDLSDRLRGEDERSRLSEQLARAQRLDAVGQIAGGLAHDLNNLLVVMVSNLSLAMESVDDAIRDGERASIETVRDDLHELQVAIDRAGGLTSKLMQFARQDDGARSEADVAEVIDAVMRLVGRSLGDEIQIEVVAPDELPRVMVDPVQLERVLVNLIINARDAIEGEGTICIEVERTPDQSRLLGDEDGAAGVQGEGVRIAIRDDGKGMDEGTKARAFEPLFTTRGGAGGSGLGLATVLAFVEEVDGQVDLESTLGEGTTISITLPAEQDPVAVYRIGMDVPVAGARVLLVDPGERTRRVISAMLTGAGYRVTSVASAEAALDTLRDERVDLLVTELALPGMPGTRLIEQVRRGQPDLPCIVVAPVGQSATLRGTPVLAKPFSHTRLLRAVEELVRRR